MEILLFAGGSGGVVGVALLFWLLYIIAFLFFGWSSYSVDRNYNTIGTGLLWWVLIGLLGYGTFGSPL